MKNIAYIVAEFTQTGLLQTIQEQANQSEGTTVDSTAIDELGYNDVTQTLLVTFINGDTYTYFGVPRGVYEWLLEAGSVGQMFNAVVKGNYPYSLQ